MFTRILPGFHDYTYVQRLQLLNLESLEARTKGSGYVYVILFKIVKRAVNFPLDNFFEFVTEHYNTRGYKWRLRMK